MLRKTLSAIAVASVIAAATTIAAKADGYKGPHRVLAYNGNEYAIVKVGRGITIYRALGSKWQRLGGTLIRKGQRTSNGSIRQNIYFKGRYVRSVTGDLRNPFYQYYNLPGGRFSF